VEANVEAKVEAAEPPKSNLDFRHVLEKKRKAEQSLGVGGAGAAAGEQEGQRDGEQPKGEPKKKKKKKKDLLNHKRLLAEWLISHRLSQPRYGEVTVHPASARKLGYFAEAFEAVVTIDGAIYASDKPATTRERAAHRAAAAALQALQQQGG